MAQEVDVIDAVRIIKSIKEEENLYILVSEEGCFAKFAYENRPENQTLRDVITAVCDAVTAGQLALKAKREANV
jgi:hypothetical protein